MNAESDAGAFCTLHDTLPRYCGGIHADTPESRRDLDDATEAAWDGWGR